MWYVILGVILLSALIPEFATKNFPALFGIIILVYCIYLLCGGDPNFGRTPDAKPDMSWYKPNYKP